MNVKINRLDPNVPDPIESRRRAAGRLVRFTYGATVFGILAFFVVYFGAPLVFLSGPGTVTAPRYAGFRAPHRTGQDDEAWWPAPRLRLARRSPR